MECIYRAGGPETLHYIIYVCIFFLKPPIIDSKANISVKRVTMTKHVIFKRRANMTLHNNLEFTPFLFICHSRS